ncbi:SH3 domain-containing protein [Acinetobacter sp. NCu2D-2]|uniref:SH3 domain-containing protein n=1 Tax=Acinetobacter sp. NCu2D-2 TaxID=1608473 RepID=UPI000AB5FA38|nr:SH3 domain-containing protein [Acinetobacter sp. NCu2D-2]
MNINKSVHGKKSQPIIAQSWLKDLQKHQDRLDFRIETQAILKKIIKSPSIEEQQQDLSNNYNLLLQRPLTKLQSQRLFQDFNQHHLSFEYAFQTFEQMWHDQCVIHPETLKRLDPHYISQKFANADTARYQNYLIRLLFILLSVHPLEKQLPDYIHDYVAWMNGLEKAQTTAKVTLRSQPDIQSDVLLELPKHSIVNVYHDDNSLWKKIRLADVAQTQDGYVMSAYLKF